MTNMAEGVVESHQRIVYLRFRFVQVTDAGIAFLAEMPNLSHIALEDTDVTPGGVDKLKQLLPHCVVGA